MTKTSPHIRAAGIPWRTILTIGALCVAGGLLARKIDVEAVHAYASQLNGGVAFLLLTVLPLGGFPVTVLHVAAGIRFGVQTGIVLVAISILLQLLASYALVYLFRDKFSRRLETIRKRIPRTAHASMCLFTMVLPGIPYFAKNYVLPLLRVPLRTYLLVCWPIHVARSVVAIAFGDQSDDLTPGRIALLAAYFSVTVFVSWWLYRKLRAKTSKEKPRVVATTRPKAA